MVNVSSSLGGMVQIEVKGIAEVLDFLRKKNIEINSKAELGLVQAANFMQQEVQESIIGARAEPKSVATGTFANSIMVDKVSENVYAIFPRKVSYPNGGTTSEVALMLEFGTSRLAPRSHFRNSLFRNRQRALEIIKNATKI